MATILLVEDEASMRLLTCAKLKHQFTIICAKDGVEALELLERQPVDLIIADVMMPRMDGYTLVQTLREDFINSFSHEFKTPITAVSGFAELLQEPGLTEEERSQYLQIIAEEAHRLANLANSTLLMSRLESQHSIPEKEPFPLDEQIKRCTILLSSAWEKKRIAFSADLEPVSYVGNEELMRHVWLNLLNNAIKFTPEGGEVSVTLQCSPEQIQVRISDTGIGMSPEMMTHIFDQYYQGEPNHTEKGLGLGLSIVHRIVELCGGQILVDSIPDQGSVFTVLLPRSR